MPASFGCVCMPDCFHLTRSNIYHKTADVDLHVQPFVLLLSLLQLLLPPNACCLSSKIYFLGLLIKGFEYWTVV